MEYKRILTIQDISCVGQCSMTVALPILSACGHETCILPTALLSTHTGGFGKPKVVRFEQQLPAVWQHWKENGICFDGILTGYLGSVEAIDCAKQIIENLLGPGGIVIADPAMADHGRLYSGLDAHYAGAMEDLCRRADIIVPNVTEAAYFSGLPYEENMDYDYVNRLLDGLKHKNVVLTGVGFAKDQTGVVVRSAQEQFHYQHQRIGTNYHGTGDIFTACLTGALLQGKSLRDSVRIAADFTCKSIENTNKNPAHWYGVKFETALPDLYRMLAE